MNTFTATCRSVLVGLLRQLLLQKQSEWFCVLLCSVSPLISFCSSCGRLTVEVEVVVVIIMILQKSSKIRLKDIERIGYRSNLDQQ